MGIPRTVTIVTLVAVMATPIVHAGELGINLYGYSHHTHRDDLNEHNSGAGVRYELNPNVFAEIGQFKDSMDDTSRYVAGAYQFRAGPVGIGASAFVMTRPSYKDNSPFVAALPFVTLETGPVITNLVYIPEHERFKLEETYFIFWTIRFSSL